jgi:hypothetical protein
MLKMHNSSYKCNNTNIVASMVLTYSWLSSNDKLLFTVSVITVRVYEPLISKLSVQKDESLCRALMCPV